MTALHAAVVFELYVKNILLVNITKYHKHCSTDILFHKKERSFCSVGPLMWETVMETRARLNGNFGSSLPPWVFTSPSCFLQKDSRKLIYPIFSAVKVVFSLYPDDYAEFKSNCSLFLGHFQEYLGKKTEIKVIVFLLTQTSFSHSRWSGWFCLLAIERQ